MPDSLVEQSMASETMFPSLQFHDLQPTLGSLQAYAVFLGRVRRALTPPQKHWLHASLQVAVNGLTTTPIPAGSFTFEMVLDLINHELVITSSRGEQWRRPLHGQSPAQFYEEGLGILKNLGIEPDIDNTLFAETKTGQYDAQVVQDYFHALVQVDTIFKQFRSVLREETSPVQFWPHHFDLALLWFSGRMVPGTDPADPEYADEQMNFGFSPGDDTFPNPYFYATAYPLPDGLTDAALPADAFWHTESFTGALMIYESLVEAEDPADNLLSFLRTVQRAGASLMA